MTRDVKDPVVAAADLFLDGHPMTELVQDIYTNGYQAGIGDDDWFIAYAMAAQSIGIKGQRRSVSEYYAAVKEARRLRDAA